MEFKVREAKREDLAQAAELIVRMKRLNGEFDPLFKVVEDAQEKAVRYLESSISSAADLVLVAVSGKKVLGVLRAEVRERTFYEPRKEGVITDFYILPEGRRKAMGNEVLEQASGSLRKMGAQMILAEFPAQNEIAARFYSKRGFRPLVNTFAERER